MSTDDRLREPPAERLAGAVQRIDLNDAISQLRAEPHRAKDGHRQVVLARQGSRSIVLFAFEQGGELKPHQTDGEVTIHVLSGTLEVTVDAGPLMLSEGQFVALAPSERHAVRAVQDSEMLLTVCHRTASSPQ
jgi:quercetin dioxygenase-like cupin family protein